MIDTDIATHIRDQIKQLDADREALTDALVILQSAAPAPTDPGPAAPARPTPNASRASAPAPTKVIPLGKILRLLADNDGQTTSALAKVTGGDQGRILELLKEAEAGDKVKRSGERRGTRWHLVTEESRIAERVAELEAGPDPAAVERRRAARRKAAINRTVKAAKAAA